MSTGLDNVPTQNAWLKWFGIFQGNVYLRLINIEYWLEEENIDWSILMSIENKKEPLRRISTTVGDLFYGFIISNKYFYAVTYYLH